MLRRSIIKAGLAAAAAPLTPAFAQAPGDWRVLFDGDDLDSWRALGGANWRIVDGAVQADGGMAGFLVSNQSFADFVLRVEFWVSPDANSGVFIRCSNPNEVTADNAYEVNIYDARPDPTYATGGIVNVGAVAQPAPKAGGRWNVYEIIAEGDRMTAMLNGRRTVSAAVDGKYASGPIALQWGAGLVKFRRVEIRPL